MDKNLSLKNVGLKITPARLAILELFSKDCKPLDAAHIHKHLSRKGINQVTIYRTLSSLEVAGILCRVDIHKDSLYYELAEHHHHHIICTSCGALEPFEVCDVDTIAKKVLNTSKTFKKISHHSLELFGLCTACQK